jgi:MFS family permease
MLLTNIAMGLTYPLRNLYIRDAGVPIALIGTIGTAGMLAFSLTSSFLAWLSDLTEKRQLLLTGSLLVGALSNLAYVWAGHYWHFLLLQVLNLGSLGAYNVLVNARVTGLLPSAEQGRGFGLYRISGSFGFAAASFSLSFVVANLGIRAIFVCAAIACFLAFGAGLLMGGDSDAKHIVRTGEESKIQWHPFLVAFFAAVALANAGSSMAVTFLSIFLKDTLAASEGQIGFISTVGVLSEVPAMLFMGQLSDSIGRGLILTASFGALALRWFMLYRISYLWPVYLIEVLRGVAMARATVSTALISDLFPYEQRATVMGIQQLILGVGSTFGPAVGGVLAERAGIRVTFLVASLTSLVAGLLVYALQKPLQGVAKVAG